MKVLILSTHPTILKWKSLPAKLAVFTKAYNSGKNANFTVDLKQINVTPKVVAGRIDHAWLKANNEPFYKQGYDIIKFHGSLKQKKDWGIKTSLRGSNPNEKSDQENMWFFCDENTKRKGLNAFEQVGLHEGAHGYYDHTDKEDITHVYHGANPDITGLFKTFDWSLWKPFQKKEISRLLALLRALTGAVVPPKPLKLLHPVERYKDYISQAYGNPNAKLYPRSGVHIGTDYACPSGTPVLAPWAGKVTASGNSPAMGNFCYYEYTFNNQKYVARFMHLLAVPVQASYQRGEVLELSGNTGMSSGAHLHADLWKDEVRLDLITKTNWNKLTTNPETHYE